MMMSSVHHLGDAVLMAPHHAKQAREPFLAPGRGSFLEREARARVEPRDSGQSRWRRRRPRTQQHVETNAHS